MNKEKVVDPDRIRRPVRMLSNICYTTSFAEGIRINNDNILRL